MFFQARRLPVRDVYNVMLCKWVIASKQILEIHLVASTRLKIGKRASAADRSGAFDCLDGRDHGLLDRHAEGRGMALEFAFYQPATHWRVGGRAG
jgi:hypothetical protein